MASKTSQVLTHAKRAFFTRYEIKLTEQVYRQIVDDIRHRKSRIILSQGNSVIHEVVVNGTKIPVVYRNQQIVTALPECCLDASKIGII